MFERRSIDELIALYQLEPSLRDVFVEGPSDRSFLLWYIRAKGLDGNTAIKEVDTVQVPGELCERLGLSTGNRNELIALSALLEDEHAGLLRSLRCWIDKDVDAVEWPWTHLTVLIPTDGPALESYVWHEDLIRKVLGQHLPRVNCDGIVEQTESLLRWVFCFTVVNQRPDWGLDRIPFTRVCSLSEEGKIILDRTEFLIRVLNKSGRRRDLDRLAEEIESMEEAVAERPDLIHGKDVADLLAWFIRELDGRSRSTGEDLRKHLVGALEVAYLQEKPAFQALEWFLAA